MAKQVQTSSGQCPTHGSVTATREIPKLTFPFVYWAIVRYFAKRKPFRCPDCGAAVN